MLSYIHAVAHAKRLRLKLMIQDIGYEFTSAFEDWLITAAPLGAPVRSLCQSRPTNASFHPTETRAPKQRWDLLCLSITAQLTIHVEKPRDIKTFSSCPTAALSLGNSNKRRTSWWHRSWKSSVDQTVSFRFSLQSVLGQRRSQSSWSNRLSPTKSLNWDTAVELNEQPPWTATIVFVLLLCLDVYRKTKGYII